MFYTSLHETETQYDVVWCDLMHGVIKFYSMIFYYSIGSGL